MKKLLAVLALCLFALRADAVMIIQPQVVSSNSATFQQGVASYSGTTDNYIRGGASYENVNYDTQGIKSKQNNDLQYERRTLISFDISSISDAVTITSVKLELTLSSVPTASKTQYLHQLRRTDWVENEATWNIYSTGNFWTSSGADDSSNDMYGTINSSTGSISSYTTTGSEVDTTVVEFPTSSAFVAAVQNSLAGDKLSMILHQQLSGGGDFNAYDSENGTASYCPKLTVTWS